MLRRIEGVENVVQVLTRNAAPRVSHVELNPSAWRLFAQSMGADRELSTAGHCVKRIQEEIEQHLLDLLPIDGNERELSRKVFHDRDLPLIRFDLEKIDGRCD